MVIFKVRLKPVGHFFAVGQRPSPEMIFQIPYIRVRIAAC
jgi:hypothetical protein